MAAIIAVLIVFHVLMAALAASVGTRVIPEERTSNFLGYLHTTIGITMPEGSQVRMITLIWIGATVAIVDACLLFFFLLVWLLH